jgi:hypothetical protein
MPLDQGRAHARTRAPRAQVGESCSEKFPGEIEALCEAAI